MPGIAPRIRGGLRGREPYPLNEIPDEVVNQVGKYISYLRAIGRTNITGDDWGDAFAAAINGGHLARPLGVVDVHLNGMGWSTKTVTNSRRDGPPTGSVLRLISGRNSPDFSVGIRDPHADLQRTGDAVLRIWNERCDTAHAQYFPLRVIVLVRSADLNSYVLFEEALEKFNVDQYVWSKNSTGNLIGVDRMTARTCFTWQPHGAQFTIHSIVPEGARRFRLMEPPRMDVARMLEIVGYRDAWITLDA